MNRPRYPNTDPRPLADTDTRDDVILSVATPLRMFNLTDDGQIPETLSTLSWYKDVRQPVAFLLTLRRTKIRLGNNRESR